MVTLLALLYAATQRIRVRARARARLNDSNRTCAATRHCASTTPGCEWLQAITRMSVMGGSVSLRVTGYRGHSASHARAQRCFSFCFRVCRFSYPTKRTPLPCWPLISVAWFSRHHHHTGHYTYWECCVCISPPFLSSFCFCNFMNPCGHLVFLSDDEDALTHYYLNIYI